MIAYWYENISQIYNIKGIKDMKKCFKFLSILVLSGSLLFTNVIPSFAAATVTKSTPYGTLYGSIGGGVSSNYGGKFCSGVTRIDQKVNRIIFSVEAKKQVLVKLLAMIVFQIVMQQVLVELMK